MTDLEDEFDKLLAEGGNKHVKSGKPGTRAGVREGDAAVRKGDRVGVADKKHADSRPVQRKPVHAGLEAGPAAADEPRRVVRPSRGSTEKEWGKGGPVTPFEPFDIPPSRYPKRFHPGELVRGDSVWYRGERYYIDYFPTVWAKGTFARVASICPRPEEDPAAFGHRVVQSEAMAFCLPVDTLEKAPVNPKPYSKQPTKSAVERRAEMKKAGVTDIGDEVAVMLRECETLDQVYECASLYVGMTIDHLKSRYGRLNPGQQRMNLGNKMRHTLKGKQK